MKHRPVQLIAATALALNSLGTNAARIVDIKDPVQAARWVTYSDQVIPGGSSVSSVERRIEGGIALLRIQGELKPGFIFPYAGVQLPLRTDGQASDWSSYKGLRFKVRGDGKVYRVGLQLNKVKDHDEHGYYFKTSSEWQTIEVPFDQLKQSGFGRRIGWDPRLITHLSFQAGGVVTRFGLDVHDVEVF